MARTTPGAVQKLLADNWDGRTELAQFIEAASPLVDEMKRYAALKITPYSHTTVQLELIERWLAAHFYCQNDPLYMSSAALGASGGFQRAAATDDFGSTDYGKSACRMDVSGVLSAIGKRQFAFGFHVGRGSDECCGT